MKKEYCSPAVSEIKVEASGLIAESVPTSSDPAQQLYPGGGDAREEMIWDEDEMDW